MALGNLQRPPGRVTGAARLLTHRVVCDAALGSCYRSALSESRPRLAPTPVGVEASLIVCGALQLAG